MSKTKNTNGQEATRITVTNLTVTRSTHNLMPDQRTVETHNANAADEGTRTTTFYDFLKQASRRVSEPAPKRTRTSG